MKPSIITIMVLTFLAQSLSALSAPCPMLSKPMVEQTTEQVIKNELQASKVDTSPCHSKSLYQQPTAKDTQQNNPSAHTQTNHHSDNCCGETTCPMGKISSGALLTTQTHLQTIFLLNATPFVSFIQSASQGHEQALLRPPIFA